MALVETTIIVADDLTGANDTALQFFKEGYSTKIIIDRSQNFENVAHADIWAISTESRNIDRENAVNRVVEVSQKLKESLATENFYKKIDSTLRGNIGLEIVAMLEALQKDIAIVAPAYIEEGRTTIGGYELLEGVVIERTQCALDPLAPVHDSFIPDILKKDLNIKLHDLIDTIGLNTVTKGAGPIILKINELAQSGKKILVLDAMSTTDLEQIALAIDKCSYDVLPCGSAGLAKAINKIKGENTAKKHDKKIPNLPRLIISGSATQLNFNQIQKLKDKKDKTLFVDLTVKNIVDGVQNISCEMLDLIKEAFNSGKDVIIHSSYIKHEMPAQEAQDKLIDAGIAQDEFSDKITDFLSGLLYEINKNNDFILIMVGGETSYKCASKIDSAYFEVLDAICPAIPLCIDKNGKFIVTKSGNFGSINTLCEIIDYFDKLKNENI